MSLDAEEVYQGAWGVAPDESQPWTAYDLDRDVDGSQEDSVREIWAVFQNGGLASFQLYPTEEFAKAAALGWARSYPHDKIRYARVELHELTVRG